MTPPTGEAIKVLTVDDDPVLLDTMSLYLEAIGGFSVYSTTSAKDALDRLETEYFDICISDYDMPEMNGVQLLGRIRGEGNPVPYILVTGNFSDGLETRARGAGASEVLRKNGSGMKFYTDLTVAVRRAVETSRGGGVSGAVGWRWGAKV